MRTWPLTPSDEINAIRLALIRRMGKRHPDLDDVASDVWLKLDRLRESYDRAKASPATFISQIASSAVIDLHRRKTSRARREEHAARAEIITTPPPPAAGVEPPTEETAAMDSARETYSAILTALRQSGTEITPSHHRLSIPTRAALARLRELLGPRARGCLRGNPGFRRDIDLPRVPCATYFAITFDKKKPFETFVRESVQSVVEAAKHTQGIRAMALDTLPRRKYTVPTNEAAKLLGWSVFWLLRQSSLGKFSYLPGKPNLYCLAELIEYDQSRVVPRRVAEREIVLASKRA